MPDRLRSEAGPVLVALLITSFVATPANAFGPSVLFAPSGDCNRPYCTTYAKSVQTNTGRILATGAPDQQWQLVQVS